MRGTSLETKSPYTNLLQAVEGIDHPVAWVTLGPCTGDDEAQPTVETTRAELNPAGRLLGPCVGDDDCDRRLKKDVQPVERLPNGLQLYSFKYWNDDQTFVCVMAQDLLKDERFSHAVTEGESGYYRVNLAALGLSVQGSPRRLREAGRRAVQEMSPAIG